MVDYDSGVTSKYFLFTFYFDQAVKFDLDSKVLTFLFPFQLFNLSFLSSTGIHT
jgi:hypothetical protein